MEGSILSPSPLTWQAARMTPAVTEEAGYFVLRALSPSLVGAPHTMGQSAVIVLVGYSDTLSPTGSILFV